jgi:hypothetical protein
MTYTWHDVDGRMAELCDECGFDARELTGGEDEAARLDTAYADLERLLDHPDAGRRPAPETWSAREYVDHCVEVAGALLEFACSTAGAATPEPPADLAGCRRAVADVIPPLTTAQRAEVLADTYPQPVTVEWLIRHLLHDTEHHVLDLRRGYAKLAMADFREVPFGG